MSSWEQVHRRHRLLHTVADRVARSGPHAITPWRAEINAEFGGLEELLLAAQRRWYTTFQVRIDPMFERAPSSDVPDNDIASIADDVSNQHRSLENLLEVFADEPALIDARREYCQEVRDLMCVDTLTNPPTGKGEYPYTMVPVLRAKTVNKRYGKRKVLNGLHLEVFQGDYVGIVGENGAGKSTLLRILAGLQRPDSGQVYRTGKLGYCPQKVFLNESLTVRQHLYFFRQAYKITKLDYAYELVSNFTFERYLDTPVHALSGGTQQKLNLVLALMHDPDMLLLDEPYQGFDWETYLQFWEVSKQLRNQGKSILVISHLVFDQEKLDHVYKLHDGELYESQTDREVQ